MATELVKLEFVFPGILCGAPPKPRSWMSSWINATNRANAFHAMATKKEPTWRRSTPWRQIHIVSIDKSCENEIIQNLKSNGSTGMHE